MKSKIIQQGAEAIIIQEKKSNLIIKRRIKKAYRIQELDDSIRKLRTRSESKLLEKAGKLIPIPKIIKTDEKNKEIIMEFIQGQNLSENLDNFPEKKQLEILKIIGENTAKLHNSNIIHGDLTTSNMIYVEDIDKKKSKKVDSNKNSSVINNSNLDINTKTTNFNVLFIDFGLGFHSNKIEDKAVDLHLIKEALEARHFKNWEKLFKAFEKGYKNQKNTGFKEAEQVINRLKKVESRGRYKEKF